MTVVLTLLAGTGIGAGLTWWACWWRSETRHMDLGRLEERHDAYRLADTRTDLDEVGPVTPGTGTTRVTMYDQDRPDLPELTQ